MEKDTLNSSVDNSEVGYEYGDVWSPTPLTEKQLKELKLWQHKQELRYQSRIAKENFKENRNEKFLTFKMEKRVLERKHRKTDKDEIDILFEVLKGNFLTDLANSFTSSQRYPYHTLKQYLRSKRPFGNKSVVDSIAYHLHWNYDFDTKKYVRLSPAVICEAERIFALLDNELGVKTGRYSFEEEYVHEYANRLIHLKLITREVK